MARALSVIVPMLNEEACVAPLVDAVQAALGPGSDWELLLVDDGSTDRTATVVRELAREEPRIRLLSLARNYGQTAAMQAGFDHARGKVVVTLDGDLQNDPADIPLLVAKLDEGYDLVAGYRVRRRDSWTRKVPSWVANRIIRGITGVPIRDNGCSLKAYRRELLDRITLYADLHRFIPAVAAAMADARIVEVAVRHHSRQYGRSKYGFTRIWKVLGDLLTILMIRRFRERPLLLFGRAAFAALVMGLLFVLGTVGVRIQHTIPDRVLVLPAAAAMWLALAFYLLMLGLIGEAALREARAERLEPPPLAGVG